MITLEQFMKLIDYKITEGSEWYGNIPELHSLSYWNGKHDDGGVSMNIVFSTKDQRVYMVEVCDYGRNKAYRLHDPELKTDDVAWDEVRYTTLETDEDFMSKATAIVYGEPYDDRVSIPIDLPDDVLLPLFKAAHERDITFNQLVAEIIESECKHILRNKEILDGLNEYNESRNEWCDRE
jgi:hypothetical protein